MNARPSAAVQLRVRALSTLVLSVVLGACAAPSAPTSAGPSTPVAAVMVWFDAAVARSVRTALEARGWTFVGTRLDIYTGIESMVFVESSSIVRTEKTARMRALISDAASTESAPQLSRIDLVEFECNNRTVQFLTRQSYADQKASTRTTSIHVPTPIVPVPAHSISNTLMEAGCTGRLLEASSSSEPDYSPLPSRGGSGSGVMIAPQTVLTNHHVVADCGSVEVELNGHRHRATLRKRDATADLALLDVAGLPSRPTSALRRTVVLGEAVMAAGFSRASTATAGMAITEGTVSSLSGIRNNVSQLQVFALTGPGYSGGPLLDRSGNLVGLVSAGLSTRQGPQKNTIAIKPDVVARFVQSERVPVNPAENTATLDAQALAAMARDVTLKVDCKP